MRERRVLWVVLAAFVVGMIAVAGLAAVDDDRGGPPRLPALAASAAGRDSAAMAAGDASMPAFEVEYRVSGTLPTLADHASAWDVHGEVAVDDVRRLAEALGVDGKPQAGEYQWTVTDADHQLAVQVGAGGAWNLMPARTDCGPDAPVSSSDGTVSTTICAESRGSGTATAVAPPGPATTVVDGCAMPDCPPGAACAQVCPAPTEPVPPPAPERPADLPSQSEAERIGRAFLARAGLDLDGADVRVEGGFNQWNVMADPVVGGMPTQGFGWSAGVGPKGVIQYANGWLADPTKGDDYPLAGVTAGIERLKTGSGWSAYPGGPEPLIARDTPACEGCQPQVRTITGVRLGLLFSPVFTNDGPPTEALLVPSYFFAFDDTEYEQPVVAVADEFLPKPPDVEPQPEPAPVEPGGGTGGGSGGSCSGSASGGPADAGDQPMSVEVCVDPDPASVGQPVTFDVTYSDPDAPIPDNGCNVPEPDFENGGTASCSAQCAGPPPGTPTTVAPVEPGTLAKTYTHTYRKPGTYKVTFTARSGNECEPNPHASRGEATVEVLVRG